MIDILPLSSARRHKRRYDAVITVEDPGIRAVKRLRFHNTPHPDHLVLRCEDIDDRDDTIAVPHPSHMAAALAFARANAGARLMVHCHAGVCRSTAIGLAILAEKFGAGAEERAVMALLETNPDAVPNLCMLEDADALLCRAGALSGAWHRIAEGAPGVTAHRAKKRKLLAEMRHIFSPAPVSGHFPPMRFKPDTLAPSGMDHAVALDPAFTSTGRMTAGRPGRNP